MSKPIITVEHLTKSYILRHQQQERYVALRDVLANKAKNLFTKKNDSGTREEFLALDNISFEINAGDRVGIIGRNGAGKSTLLKVLSRIITPTQGRVTIDGRMASLLEVGTGFHPELSGRENIYLNGSILGMSKSEIKSKFDEIVEFSEVERFLDTPVKRYSSGMYVRLAFSVAAHLEPEILIVDEVLAVGDAAFQRKCLGKMRDVAGQGRTVLFVSHNMAAIQNLCNTGLYLKKGKLIASGDSKTIIHDYLKDAAESHSIDLSERKERSGNGDIRFTKVSLLNTQGHVIQALQSGEPGTICIDFEKRSNGPLKNFHVTMGIDDDYGNRITFLSNELTNQIFQNFDGKSGQILIHLDRVTLQNGNYGFTLYSTVNSEIADYIIEAGVFSVEDGDFFHTGKIAPSGQGNFYMQHQFDLR